MLSVTKPALRRLSRRLARKAAGDDVALRITKLDDGWQLGPDHARSGDVKIEFYVHDAFKITSPAGLTVLTDTWRNDLTGLYPKWFLS